MKKILVIGSNSFSGSDFIDLLLDTEKYEVLGISRSAEKSSLFLPYKKKDRENFKFHQINLNTEMSLLKEILKQFQPHYVINFAAQSEVAPSWQHPEHWFQTNAVAITQLANELKNMRCLEKYVHISSPEVYGSCNGIITENAPLNPSTPYAASKAASDLSLFTFFKNFQFPLILIRSTNVYGARQQLFKIIPRSIINIKNKNKIDLHGGGESIKSYIHIRDISLGELLIMEQGSIGQIYHLSPDQGVSVKKVVELICHQMGVSFVDVTRQVEERLGQDAAYIIDSTKIRQLGWQPSISLFNGIEKTIEWIEENYQEIIKEPLYYVHKE